MLAGNGCTTGRLGDDALYWEAFFIVLITTVDSIMSLQEVSSGKAHVAGKAFEWLNVCVSKDMSFEMFISGKRLPAICTEDHLLDVLGHELQLRPR